MRRFLYLIICLQVFLASAKEIEVNSILEKADAIRNPSDSFFMEVRVESKEDSEESLFEVYTKGKDKTLIKTIMPTMNRGRNLLMLEENMWVYIPNLKRAVRVSLSQKLTGQAANGDISRMRWASDYEPKLIDQDKDSWNLFLTAKKKGLTYDKIRIWVAKKNFHPIKAEYLTVNEKVLKTAWFDGYREIAGGVRPTKIRIESALNKEDTSLIEIKKMEVKNFPESNFQKDNLQ